MNTNKIFVADEMLFYAFRYALGRRSYAVTWVIDNILANIKELPTEMLKNMVSEIGEASDLGMPMDEKEWVFLYRQLARELENR